MSRRRARKRDQVAVKPVPRKLEQLFNPYNPIEALDSQALDRIHDASMEILEDIGLEVLNETALGLYEQDGAKVDWDLQRVYLDRKK